MAEILGDSLANKLVGSGNGNDSIIGFEGNDTLWVDWGGSNNTLDGGAGADSLYSSYSDHSLFRGGDDNDILEVYGWNNTLEGGLGDDTYNLYSPSANTIRDAGGTDILWTGLKLSLNGLAPGEAGLEKQGTNLVIDINQDGIAENDQDMVILDFFNAAGTGAGTGFMEKIDYLDGNEILNSPTSPNIITGTANADNLEGTNANDSIMGDAGDDSIVSDGSGNDTLRGDDGNDRLIDFGAGRDFLDGGSGNDTLDGGTGRDTLDGGAGDDYLSNNEYYYYYGYSDQDSLFGGVGNDTLSIESYGAGHTLDGGAGADSLYVQTDSSLLLGGDANDILEVGYGWNNTLEGGLGDDSLTLNSNAGSGNVLQGGNGSDIYRLRVGYWGEAGVEIADTEGNDTLIILENELPKGDMVTPLLKEPTSAVKPLPVEPISAVKSVPVPPAPVTSSVPLSPLLGDPIWPLEPTEVKETGLAAGVVGLGRMGTSLVIDINKDGWANRWDVVVSNFFDAAGTGAGSGFIETVGNLSGEEILAADLPEVTFDEPIQESPKNDGIVRLTSSANPIPVVPASGGAVVSFSLPNTLPHNPKTFKLGRPTHNTTDPGAATGQLPNQASGEFYNLSDGDDNVFLSQITQASGLHVRGLSGTDIIQGSEGADIINGNQGNDTLKGNVGNDLLRGGRGSDQLDGESGDDVLNGNKDNDTLFGGDGNDLLRGGKGDDNLFGGNGNDVVCGDLGQDFLTGDSGSDTFVLRDGEAAASTLNTADVILDFKSSEDKIGLTNGITYQNLTFESVNFGLGDASEIVSVAIKFGDKYLGIVQGFTAADLTGAMFVNADDLIWLG